MDGISETGNTRAALNGAGVGLKLAAQAEKAVVQVVEEAIESARAAAPEGQGRHVDKVA